MNIGRIYSALHQLVDAYRKRLGAISDDEFSSTPPIGGWSYSEVYSHIFDSSLLSLEALAQCLHGKGEDRPTALAARLILFAGMLPPGLKFKVPKRLASRVKVISKLEAAAFMDQFLEKLSALEPEISHASAHVKTPHPRFGYLNARQWLRFTEVHLNHHLKQLKRIEKSYKK